MANIEQTSYPPGIYLEIYHARKNVSFDAYDGGIHAYLVYRTKDGQEFVLRGGQPTSRQSWLARNSAGVLGGHIETETGPLKNSIDRNDGKYRPHRMVIPVRSGPGDEVLWKQAEKRVQEIGTQKYDYDVTDSSQLFSSASQNSNSVVSAALREMGINTLDIVPDDLIEHLPGIRNDLTHGPKETRSIGDMLETRRITGTNADLDREGPNLPEEELIDHAQPKKKPQPVNTDLIEHNEYLKQLKKEKQIEDQQRQDQMPAAPKDRETDFAKARAKEVQRLADAVTAPPASRLEATSLSDPAKWNHGQLMGAMKSSAYWDARKANSDSIRSGVTKRFKGLTKGRGLPKPEEFNAKPAEPEAKGGTSLASSQSDLLTSLKPIAERRGVSTATRATQKALNDLTFASKSPLLTQMPHPLKVDGIFGPRTQQRTREVLNRVGTAPLQRQINSAFHDIDDNEPL